MLKKDSTIVRLDIFIKRIPWWLFVLLGNCIIFLFNLSFSETGFAEEQVEAFVSDIDLLVSSIFLAPLIETFLFQLVPIEITIAICKECFRKRMPYFAILVSSFMFAFSHDFNREFIFFAFLTGIILASCYLVFRRQKHYGYGYAITFLLHLVVNTTSYLFNHYV